MSRTKTDVVYTPDWVAQDMIDHFKPSGTILDPCRGRGAFSSKLDCLWCEIEDGVDFFAWDKKVDWVLGNPPYSKTREWLRHSYKIADNVLYLVPYRNIVSGYGCLKEMKEFGWMKSVRIYGTGNKLNFPMGNCIMAFHCQRGYAGDTSFSFYE